MEYKDLIGKTIVSVQQKKLKGYDDDGFLELKFSDETKVIIVARYGGYTGQSEDEYPTGIFITEQYDSKLEKLEDIEE